MSKEKPDPCSVDFGWLTYAEKLTFVSFFKEALLRELNSTVKSLEELRRDTFPRGRVFESRDNEK